MKITGRDLLILMETMKDSFNLPLGCEWVFTYKLDQRKKLYDTLLRSILNSEAEVSVEEDGSG